MRLAERFCLAITVTAGLVCLSAVASPRAYVANAGSNEVSVTNPAMPALIDTINLGMERLRAKLRSLLIRRRPTWRSPL